MTSFQEKIAKAQAEGVSDSEIRSFLEESPEVKQAIKAGASMEEIWDHLGLGSASPERGLGESLQRGRAIGAGALLKGGAAVLGLPGTIESLGNSFLPAALTRPLGSPEGTPPNQFLPTVEETMGWVDQLGLGGPTPETTTENYLAAGGQGAGAALATLPLGGPVIPAIASGISGGLAAEAASEAFPKSKWAPLVGGLIGGLGTLGAFTAFNSKQAGNLAKAAEKEAALAGDLVGQTKAGIEELKTLDFDLGELRKQVGDSHKQVLEGAIKNNKALALAAKETAEAEIASATSAAKQVVEKTAEGFGPAKTLQEAGTALQVEARSWLSEKLPKRLEEIWSPIDSAIPEGTEVSLGSFGSALAQINKQAGALEPLNQLLKPGAPKSLQRALGAVKEGQEEGLVAPTSWKDIKTLRSTLGDAMSNPKVLNDVGSQNLSHLYAALSEDMRRSLVPLGLDSAFDSANASSKSLYDFAEGTIGKIVKGPRANSEDLAPEAVAKLFLGEGGRGGTGLAALRAELPSSANALAAAGLRQGQWGKLAPEAKEALVPDAQLRNTLDNSALGEAAAVEGAKLASRTKIQEGISRVEELRRAAASEARELGTKSLESKRALFEKKQELAKVEAQAKLASEQAKQAAAKIAKPEINPLADIARTVKGIGAGGAGGAIATNILGLSPHAATAIGLGAAAIPFLGAAAKAIVKKPSLLREPARGVVAGNALSIESEQ